MNEQRHAYSTDADLRTYALACVDLRRHRADADSVQFRSRRQQRHMYDANENEQCDVTTKARAACVGLGVNHSNRHPSRSEGSDAERPSECNRINH